MYNTISRITIKPLSVTQPEVYTYFQYFSHWTNSYNLMKWNLVLHNQPQLFGLFYDRVMQVACFTLVHPSGKKEKSMQSY